MRLILESRSGVCGCWFLERRVLVVGAAVAASGSVGYVGLIVPHLVRLTVGSDNRLGRAVFGDRGCDICCVCRHDRTDGDRSERIAGRCGHGADRRTDVYLFVEKELATKARRAHKERQLTTLCTLLPIVGER